jgi:hypothetical protein
MGSWAIAQPSTFLNRAYDRLWRSLIMSMGLFIHTCNHYGCWELWFWILRSSKSAHAIFMRLIDWLFTVLRPAQEFFTYPVYGDVTITGERAAKFRPMLGTQGLWAGRDLYRVTPAVARDLGISGLIRRNAPFSRLLRHTRGCGWSILTWIRTSLFLRQCEFRHYVFQNKSYALVDPYLQCIVLCNLSEYIQSPVSRGVFFVGHVQFHVMIKTSLSLLKWY